MLSRSLRKGSSTLARKVRHSSSSSSNNKKPLESLSSLDVHIPGSKKSDLNLDAARATTSHVNISMLRGGQPTLSTPSSQLQLHLKAPQALSSSIADLMSLSTSMSSVTHTKKNNDDELLNEMSHAFYKTMQNVLQRTSTHLVTTDVFQNTYKYKSRSTSGGFSGGSGNEYGRMQMIQCRQFSSSAPQTTEQKEDDSQSQSPSTAAQSSSSASKSSPPPTASATATAATATKTLATKEKSVPDKAQAMLQSAISTIVSFIMKIPGVLWFYLTHPKEFKEKMMELKEAAKKEAHHYYMGTKLLIADLRTAKKMLARSLNGTPLTRRERKQLIRTVTDVFRLVPMSIFVLIPFMEFALPFALKLFPNMLPSTFQDSLKAEENMKRELKSRLAMAEFFQE